MRLARELADRIVALEYANLPAAARYGSRIAVLDTLGGTLAGSREAAPQIVESAAAASQMITQLESVASIRDLTALLEPVRQVKIPSLAHA